MEMTGEFTRVPGTDPQKGEITRVLQMAGVKYKFDRHGDGYDTWQCEGTIPEKHRRYLDSLSRVSVTSFPEGDVVNTDPD